MYRLLIGFVVLLASRAYAQDILYGPASGSGIESRVEWSQRPFIRQSFGGGWGGDWGGGD